MDIFLYGIFPLLTQKEVLKLERVCKSFQTIVFDCTKEIIVTSNLFNDFSLLGLPKYTNLKSLDIRGIILSKKTMGSLDKLTHLETLSMRYPHRSDPLEEFTGISTLKDLKNLYIYSFSGNLSYFSGYSKLETLKLEQSILYQIPLNFQNKFTSVNSLYIPFKQAKEYAVLNLFPNLTHFGSPSRIKSTGLKIISKMVNLESLDIYAEGSLLVSCQFLDNLKKLKILQVENINMEKYKPQDTLETLTIIDKSYTPGLNYDFLKSLKSLKTLNLHIIRLGINQIPKLDIEHLSLESGSFESHVLNLASLFENLKTLKLFIGTDCQLEYLSLEKMEIINLRSHMKIKAKVNELILTTFYSLEPVKDLDTNILVLNNFNETFLKVEDFKDIKARKIYMNSSISQLTFLELIETYPKIKFYKNY